MKILHFLNLEDYSTSSGIIHKSFKKVKSWKRKGNEVELVMIYNSDQERDQIESIGQAKMIHRTKQRYLGQYRLMRLTGKQPFHEKQLHQIMEQFGPDIVYHRAFEISGFIRSIAKKYRTVVEINGNEIGNYFTRNGNRLQSIFNRLRAKYLKHFMKGFLQSHAGIVFVTHELRCLYERYTGIPLRNNSIVIPNGIDVQEVTIRKSPTPSDIIRLVFMGSPNMKWHGLDAILSLASKTVGLFEFHIIGESFADKSALPENVITYGYLTTAEYSRVLSYCHIGIGTMSLISAGITEASPLKVREYVAMGLPVILGYTDTAFINRSLPHWALVVPNSENGALSKLDDIVRFAREMKDVVVDKDEVEQYFSFSMLEEERLSFFSSLLDTRSLGRV